MAKAAAVVSYDPSGNSSSAGKMNVSHGRPHALLRPRIVTCAIGAPGATARCSSSVGSHPSPAPTWSPRFSPTGSPTAGPIPLREENGRRPVGAGGEDDRFRPTSPCAVARPAARAPSWSTRWTTVSPRIVRFGRASVGSR